MATLTLDVSPDFLARLNRAADEAGVDVSTYFVMTLTEILAPPRAGLDLPEAFWRGYDDLTAKYRAGVFVEREREGMSGLEDEADFAKPARRGRPVGAARRQGVQR